MKSSCVVMGALVLAVSSTALADPPPAPLPPGAPASARPPPGAPPPYAYPMPPYVAPGPVPMKTHSVALMGGGIALTTVGALSLIGGVAIIADSPSQGEFSSIFTILFGIPLLVHGLGCLAGGIPMIAVGAKKIPYNSSTDTRSLRPEVMVGTRSATLRWTF